MVFFGTRFNLAVNAPKCAILALGKLAGSPTIPDFHIGDTVIPRKTETTINGYLLKDQKLVGGWDSDSQVLKQVHKAIRAF